MKNQNRNSIQKNKKVCIKKERKQPTAKSQSIPLAAHPFDPAVKRFSLRSTPAKSLISGRHSLSPLSQTARSHAVSHRFHPCRPFPLAQRRSAANQFALIRVDG